MDEKQNNQWIKIEDRRETLPQPGQKVLVYCGFKCSPGSHFHFGVSTATFERLDTMEIFKTDRGDILRTFDGRYKWDKQITHWMPLPLAPV